MTTHPRRTFRALSLRLALATLVVMAGPATADLYFVDQNVVGGGSTGADWANAFDDLQDALDVVGSGDEIWVAAGVYVPTVETNIGDPRSATFTLVSGVAIYGGFEGTETMLEERDPDPSTNGCSLDGFTGATNVYHVVTGNSTAAGTILDGFTITNGRADGGTTTTDRGGGLTQTLGSLTLRNTLFTGNDTTGGGTGRGGAIHALDANITVEDSTFENCSAGRGGAIVTSVSTSLSIARTDFSNNSGLFSGGGALYLDSGSEVEIVDSAFIENSGNNEGGAITVIGLTSSLRLDNTTFYGNYTRGAGGAIWLTDSSSLVAVSSLFVGNAATVGNGGNGGAMRLQDSSSTVLTNCTLAYNVADDNGGGIAVQDTAQVTVQNSVLYGNSDGLNGPTLLLGGNTSAQQIYLDPGTTPSASVTYSLVEGGYTGPNIDANPLFVSTPNPGDGDWETSGDNDYGDVRVQPGSPVIDAADNSADLDGGGASTDTIADVTTDLDGGPRLIDDPSTPDTGVGTAPIVDMGAFEHSVFADGFESGETSRWSSAVP